MRQNKHMRFQRVIGGAIILLLLFILQTDKNPTVSATVTDGQHQLSGAAVSQTESSEDQNTEQGLSHETVISLTNQFMDILVQDSDENYKVDAFQTRQELLNEFEHVATKEAARPYVDFYFNEKEDGLYIKPTETPPWFHEESDYDMIQTSDNTVNVTQTNETDLDGVYTVTFEFTYDGEWKITDISHN